MNNIHFEILITLLIINHNNNLNIYRNNKQNLILPIIILLNSSKPNINNNNIDICNNNNHNNIKDYNINPNNFNYKNDNFINTIETENEEVSKTYQKPLNCDNANEWDIDRLKERYYQTGQSYIYSIDKQIKSLKIEDNDFLSYINKIGELYNLIKTECNKWNKKSLDDNYKITHIYKELINTRIHPLFIYLVDSNSYDEFKDKIYKLYSMMVTIKNLTDNDNFDNYNNNITIQLQLW